MSLTDFLSVPASASIAAPPPQTASITTPGIYDMPADEYHRDPAETPSLSAGMINNLLIAPAKCWYNSSRLNPEWQEEDDGGKFSIGSVSHVIHLEPGEFAAKVVVCDFADWRTNAAKAMRKSAKEAGKTPILKEHMDRVREARSAFVANSFTAAAFSNGKSELSMFWRHPRYDFWCRSRPDFLADSRGHLCDYKATANASPERFGKHAYDMGYHRRAAWYLEGARILFGKTPDHYWFVSQEVKPPYLTSVVELDMSALEAGHVENERAAEIFNRCLTNGDWYGYRHKDEPGRDLAFQVGLPTYAYMQIDGRV